MDPDDNLKKQLEILGRYNQSDLMEGDEKTLMELVSDLQEWISNGGRLPEAWLVHRARVREAKLNEAYGMGLSRGAYYGGNVELEEGETDPMAVAAHLEIMERQNDDFCSIQAMLNSVPEEWVGDVWESFEDGTWKGIQGGLATQGIEVKEEEDDDRLSLN